MQNIGLTDFLSKLNYQLDIPLDSFIEIGDLCAVRVKDGHKFRKNYDRGILLTALAQKFHIKTFLEFGTGRGYVTGCVSKFCPEIKKIVTLDTNKSTEVVGYFKQLNIDTSKIKFICADADKLKSNKFEHTFDMFFIDAKHTAESVKLNFELCKSLFNEKSIVVFDDYRNKFASVKKYIDTIQDFDQMFLVSTDGWLIKNEKILEHDNADRVVDGKEFDSGMVVGLKGLKIE